MLAAAVATIRSVALVIKPQNGEARALAEELVAFLRGRGLRVLLEPWLAAQLDPALESAPEAMRQADLCAVAGGDGTLIHAAALLDGAEVPIFGINAGGLLGFLTEVPRARALPLLDLALQGRCVIEPRMKLRVLLEREGAVLLDSEVVNDAILHRGALPQMVDLRTAIDGAPVCSFRADGVIVASPTGSTAYSLAANGPILYPTLDAVIVNPICPHTLTQRPLAVPTRCCTSIEVLAAGGEVQLSLDGRTSAQLRVGDRVQIERAPHRLLLVKNPELDFFRILREKLRWGER